MNGDLKRAAGKAALFLTQGISDHLSSEGLLSPASLKALAEHLSIFREVAKKHPYLRNTILSDINEIIKPISSIEFYYFCLRNPEQFRLWGSIIADCGFFNENILVDNTKFITAFDHDELVDKETAEFRKLDAIDVCSRNHVQINSLKDNILHNAQNSSLFYRSYSVVNFDTSFIYYITHFTFYISEWGASNKAFSNEYYNNLRKAIKWSVAIKDADLVSECIVAAFHCKAGINNDALIGFVIERQHENGAIIRSPSKGCDNIDTYENDRHTTLVGLWALSEYAYSNSITLSFDQPTIARSHEYWLYTNSDKNDLVQLNQMIDNYRKVKNNEITLLEKNNCRDLSYASNKIKPFLCENHHLNSLEQYSPRNPKEMSLPSAMLQVLLEIISGESCDNCIESFLCNIVILSELNHINLGNTNQKRLFQLIQNFISLPIVREYTHNKAN